MAPPRRRGDGGVLSRAKKRPSGVSAGGRGRASRGQREKGSRRGDDEEEEEEEERRDGAIRSAAMLSYEWGNDAWRQPSRTMTRDDEGRRAGHGGVNAMDGVTKRVVTRASRVGRRRVDSAQACVRACARARVVCPSSRAVLEEEWSAAMDPSLGLLTCRAAPRGGGREKVPWAPRWLRRTNEGSAVGAARRWTKEGSVGGVRHAAAAAAAAAGGGKEGRRAPRWRRGGGGRRFVTCGGVTTEGEPALPRVAGLRPLPAVVRPTRGARAGIRGGSYLRENVFY